VTADPPTVTCPGCAEPVEVEHERLTNGMGERLGYIATQTEHDALLDHIDYCPRQHAG
jgi:hypothetical protein